MTPDLIIRLLTCIIIIISLTYILYIVKTSPNKTTKLTPFSFKIITPKGEIKEVYEVMYKDVKDRIKGLENKLKISIEDYCNIPLYRLFVHFKIKRVFKEKATTVRELLESFHKMTKMYNSKEFSEEYGELYEKIMKIIGDIEC